MGETGSVFCKYSACLFRDLSVTGVERHKGGAGGGVVGCRCYGGEECSCKWDRTQSGL